MKHKESLSVKFSQVAAIAALVAIAILAVAIPFLTSFYFTLMQVSGEHITNFFVNYMSVVVFSYVCLVPVVVADIMLLRLLRLVKRAEVFTEEAVKLLHRISMCCFVEVAPVLALGFFMGIGGLVMLPTAFVGAFLGVVLCVVKDVIKCASEIKAENDFTV